MLDLISQMNSRGSSAVTDVYYLNCFPELVKNKTTQEQDKKIRKRSGSQSSLVLPATVTRGGYFWEDQNRIFIANGHNVTVYNASTLAIVTTLVNIFPATTTGDVGFTEFLYDTGIVKLVVTDGTTLSTIDSANVVVAGSDPDMPIHIPQPIYLDGYLFILKASSADLYNSDLNDPLLYTAGNFISSEMFPDRVTAVVKQNNYILVFGSDSIEYYWDAANPSGTPLQRNDTPIKLTGLRGGIAQLSNKVYFVGDNDRSQPSVFVMEDFKITEVSDECIRRFLTANASQTLTGSMVSIDGHDFYVLYNGTATYALELETNLWVKWSFGSLSYFDIQMFILANTGASYRSFFIRNGVAKLYEFLPTLYQDEGISITTQGVLDNEEFDTFNQKFMSHLTVWADRTTGSNTLLIQWSDDDYQTFNTGVVLELNQEDPDIRRLGRFRRRAFKFTHTDNQPLRIKAIEVDINIGIN